MLTRRAVGLGLLGTLGLIVVGGVPLFALAADEEAVFLAALDACFPRDGTALPSPADVDAVGNLRRYLAKLPRHTALEARGLLRALDGMPLAAYGARFTTLAQADRTAFLESLATADPAPARLIANAVKQLCAVAYFQHPATWAHLGYDGPLVNRPPEGWGAAPPPEPR